MLDRSGSHKLSTALGGHCPEQPKSHKVGRQVHACDARNLDNPVPNTHGCLGGCGHPVPVEPSLAYARPAQTLDSSVRDRPGVGGHGHNNEVRRGPSLRGPL